MLTQGLHADQICCIRQQKFLFQQLSFNLNPGELLIVEGQNGCGKSSLLRLLTGLAEPDQGNIYWQGSNIKRICYDYWPKLHYIGHTNGIKLGLTINENLKLAMYLAEHNASLHSIENVLDCLQLKEEQHLLTKYLSAGKKRRLALARLFLIKKPLWILDEPFTALDAQSIEIIRDALERHLNQQGLCVISSHHALNFNRCAEHLRLGAC